MFNILKQTVISLIDDYLPLMDDIAQLIAAGFNTNPCASGLDLVKLVSILQLLTISFNFPQISCFIMNLQEKINIDFKN